MSAEFIAVANLADLPDFARQLVEIEDRLVVLIRVGQQVFAIDDVCTHDGGPLAEGELNGYDISCPRHGARFDIRTGKALSLPATRPTVVHDVKLEQGQILVRLNSSAAV